MEATRKTKDLEPAITVKFELVLQCETAIHKATNEFLDQSRPYLLGRRHIHTAVQSRREASMASMLRIHSSEWMIVAEESTAVIFLCGRRSTR